MTVMSELVPKLSDQIWRFTEGSIKVEMREMLIEDASKLIAGTQAHKDATALVDKFDAIRTIDWDDFLEIQDKHKDQTNQKRSTLPVDLTENLKQLKKRKRTEKKNIDEKQGWKNLVNKLNSS